MGADYFAEPLPGEARAGSDAAEVAWVSEEDLEAYAISPIARRVIKRAFEMAREAGKPSSGKPPAEALG